MPAGSKAPAACREPVRENTRCRSLSWSGSELSTSVGVADPTGIGSSSGVKISSMLSVPHTPHADDIVVLRLAG